MLFHHLVSFVYVLSFSWFLYSCSRLLRPRNGFYFHSVSRDDFLIFSLLILFPCLSMQIGYVFVQTLLFAFSYFSDTFFLCSLLLCIRFFSIFCGYAWQFIVFPLFSLFIVSFVPFFIFQYLLFTFC